MTSAKPAGKQQSSPAEIIAALLNTHAALGFDEVFNRMWKFYLCYSEAGFRAGYIGVSQLTLARI